LFHYFDIAKKVVNECKALGIDEESFESLLCRMAMGKSGAEAKKSGRKKRAQEQEQFCLDIARACISKSLRTKTRLFSKRFIPGWINRSEFSVGRMY